MLKKLLFTILFLFTISLSFAQKTTIPDETFRTFLTLAVDLGVNIEAADFDEKNQIGNSILTQITTLNIPPPVVLGGQFIKDLTGIEAFTSLEQYSAQANDKNNAHKYSEIDFSQNTQLKSLNLSNNNLVRLDLSNNQNLESIDLSNNNLVNLNIANGANNKITSLLVTSNYLSCIQVDTGFTTVQTNWSFDTGATLQNTACDRYTYIPDNNFETALQNLKDDADNPLNLDSGTLDNKVLTNNINTLRQLNIGKNSDDPDSDKISDLTGIEDFTTLSDLFLENHLLASLNLSKNTNLTLLNALKNKLITVILPEAYNLSYLDLSINELSYIQNLENCTSLESLYLSNNNFTTLDISNLTNLTFVSLDANKFTSIDLSTNPNLTNIDVSEMKDGLLTSLNLKNIKSTNTSGNIASVYAIDNPNLTCVTVDENVVANRPGIWNFDNTAQFSTDGNCTTVQYTNIPDANFRQALISSQASISQDDFFDENIPTSKIEGITELNLNNADAEGNHQQNFAKVSDLTGIEDFTNLTGLGLFGHNLTLVDFSNNLKLVELEISNNNIQVLDVSKNDALVELYVDNNQLKNFNISQNIALTDFSIINNILESLNIRNGVNSKLENFDATSNTNLTCITADDGFTDKNNFPNSVSWFLDSQTQLSTDGNCTQYTTIPDAAFRQALINHNPSLGITSNDFDGDNKIETSKIAGITTLSFNQISISNLTGIEGFSDLTNLTLSSASLTSIDITKNINLEILAINLNQVDIETIDISKNTKLTTLFLQNSKIKSLNVTQNILLETIDIGDNQIETLDVGKNAALTKLNVSYNQLTSLDISKNTSLVNFDATENPSLFCIQVEESIINAIPANYIKDTIASYNQDCSTLTAIPDEQFRMALLDQDLNPNISLTAQDFSGILIATYKLANITDVKTFNDNKEYNVKSLEGIKDFTNLTKLITTGKELETLDVTKNLLLEKLSFYSQKISTLDFSKNTALDSLVFVASKVTTLNLESNINLKTLWIDDSPIQELNLEKNTKLKSLVISHFDDDQSNNLAATKLNLTNNTVLEKISLQKVLITNLDLTSNSNLKEILIVESNITTLNLKNGVNANLTMVLLTDNPDLRCIEIDNGFDPYNANNWSKDSTANYTYSCSASYTYVPDREFRHFIHEKLGGVPDDILKNVPSNLIKDVISFEISKDDPTNPIKDLTGIEGFISVVELKIFNTEAESLDLSKNTKLSSLEISYNQKLKSINLKNGNNSNLNDVKFNYLPGDEENLTCIQIDDGFVPDENAWKNYTSASYSYDCSTIYTNIPDANFRKALIRHDPSLNISANDFNNLNQIITSKISGITKLVLTGIGKPDSEIIKDLTGIEGFTSLTSLDVGSNQLTSLDLTKNTALTSLAVYYNQLTSLDVSKNTALTVLNLIGNQLTSLDVSKNIALTFLNVRGNKLTNLDVSKNTSLTDLDVSFNQLTNLDVSKNTILIEFRVHNNQITNLDLSKNAVLSDLYIRSIPALTELNIRNGNNSELRLYSDSVGSDYPNLNCIQADDGVDNNFVLNIGWFSNLEQINFKSDCNDVWTINTQDANLDTALSNVSGLDANNDGNITLAEAAAYSGTLDLSNKGIANVDGLEAFTSATEINLKNNSITNIDILNNLNNVVTGKSRTGKVEYFAKAATQLQVLDVSGNQITNIDVTNLQQLTSLNVSGNQLTSLLLNNGNNAALITLDATNNANLGCIQTDDNFTPPNTWQKEVATIYSTNCNAALSVTSQNLNQFISLYPNPAKNILQVAINSNLHVKAIEIYDVLGKRILKTKNMSINIQSLAKGVFLTKIITDKGLVTARFVKE